MSLYDFATEVIYSDHHFIPIYHTGTTDHPTFTTGSTTLHSSNLVNVKKSIRAGNNKLLLCSVNVLLLPIKADIETLQIESETYIDSQDGPGSWSQNYNLVLYSDGVAQSFLKLVLEFNKFLDKSQFEVEFRGWPSRNTKIGSDGIEDMIKGRDIEIEFRVRGIIEWKTTSKFEYDIEVTKLIILE